MFLFLKNAIFKDLLQKLKFFLQKYRREKLFFLRTIILSSVQINELAKNHISTYHLWLKINDNKSDLKKAIDKNFDFLENIFWSDISSIVSDGTLQLEDLETIKKKAKEQIEEKVNTLFNK